MAKLGRHHRKAASLVCAFGMFGLIGGCATIGGSPVETQLLGGDTYLVLGKYSDVSDTANVLQRQMTQRADQQCPGGWTKLADGANPKAMMGGRVWKIQCTGNSVSAAPPPADSGVVVAPRAVAKAEPVAATPAAPVAAKPVAAPQVDLLQLLTGAAMQGAPDISERAAQAIARAQLLSLEKAGMKVMDSKGQVVKLK